MESPFPIVRHPNERYSAQFNFIYTVTNPNIDHMSMLLIPAYTPVRRRAPLNHKDFVNLSRKFITLAAGLLSVEHQDLKEHTTSVLCYIIFSVDSVTMD